MSNRTSLDLRRRALAIAALSLSLSAGALAAHAQNLLITDYRVPVSSAQSLRANFRYDYKRIGGREVQNSGNFFADYKYFYDSLRFAYTINAQTTLDRSGPTEHYALFASETGKAYIPKAGDFFAGAEFRRQFVTNAEPAADAGLNIGYGRFINVTPLAKAVRMEDWLLSLDQLHDDLPAETMIQLGQLIQREAEFREQYGDTYRQEWFAAMQNTIRESGMMKEAQLDAGALARMKEVLTRERVFDRFFGWETRVGASLGVLENASTAAGGRRVADATLRLSRPLSWHTQWNEQATVVSPIGDDLGRAVELTLSSDFSYELSDRIDLLLSHVLLARRQRAADAGSANRPYEVVFSHRLQGTFVLFIENELTVNLNVIAHRNEGGAFRRSATMTIGYRFL